MPDQGEPLTPEQEAEDEAVRRGFRERMSEPLGLEPVPPPDDDDDAEDDSSPGE